MKITLGIFLILHGLVHLLYSGQAWRRFELKPGMLWPNGSWAFSNLFNEKTLHALAGTFCIIAALSFVTGGVLYFIELSIWRYMVITSVIFSSFLYIVFWDGKLKKLADKGAVCIFINIALAGIIFYLGQ